MQEQSINLMLPEFKQRGQSQNILFILLCLVPAIGCLVWLSISMDSENSALTERIEKLEAQRDKLAEEVQSAEQTVDSLKKTDLNQAIEEATQILKNRTALLEGIQGQSADRSFYQSMQVLQAASSADLELTSFVFSEGGAHLSLKGKAVMAEHVPDFFLTLQAHPYFKNAEFNTLNIQALGEDVQFQAIGQR